MTSGRFKFSASSLQLRIRVSNCLSSIINHDHDSLTFVTSPPLLFLLLHTTHSKHFKMDTLVAQYSQPMFEKEQYNQDDQMELYQPAPSLSLKFAMPPVAQVCIPS
jgi:hypothetical protein